MISHSVEETNKIAREWIGEISAQAISGSAAVVGLSGNLGSGKTTFTQAVARALGVTENITSPTFVIMKIYEIKSGQFKKLVHIDAYRLEKGSELEALDFKKITSDPDSLVLIEWADNVKEGLPANIQRIEFEYVGENERKIVFK